MTPTERDRLARRITREFSRYGIRPPWVSVCNECSTRPALPGSVLCEHCTADDDPPDHKSANAEGEP